MYLGGQNLPQEAKAIRHIRNRLREGYSAMTSINAIVRYTVIAFIFVAGHISFAGLDPSAKADAKTLLNESAPVEISTAEKTTEELHADTNG
jgi:hypothetical protein